MPSVPAFCDTCGTVFSIQASSLRTRRTLRSRETAQARVPVAEVWGMSQTVFLTLSVTQSKFFPHPKGQLRN